MSFISVDIRELKSKVADVEADLSSDSGALDWVEARLETVNA